MIIRKFRLQRGWSQEQLATFSGLSIRTIQRIERGQKASLESLNALAAVFEIDVATLQGEETMEHTTVVSVEEQKVMESVRDIKAFYVHLMVYLIMVPTFFVIDLMSSEGLQWAWWPVMGWGIGILSHGLTVFEVFNLFGAKWERKQIEKRLGRKI